MEIREFDLNALSSLSYRIRVCEFGGKWNPRAVILEFTGAYGIGSEGNADADFIGAIKAAALTVLYPQALVFDFHGMSYEWGNRIWNVLREWERPLPTALVISERSRPGFSTCAGAVPPMFDSLEQALEFVEAQVHNDYRQRDDGGKPT